MLNSYLVFVMRVEGDMDMFIQKEKKSDSQNKPDLLSSWLVCVTLEACC